jgi:hypothetical protein
MISLARNRRPEICCGCCSFFWSASVAFLVATFVISGFKLFRFFPAHFPGRDKLIEIFAGLSSVCASLARIPRCVWRFDRGASCNVYSFSVCRLRVGSLGAAIRFFFAIMPLNERSRLCRSVSPESGFAKKVLQIMLNGLCGRSGSKSHSHWVA